MPMICITWRAALSGRDDEERMAAHRQTKKRGRAWHAVIWTAVLCLFLCLFLLIRQSLPAGKKPLGEAGHPEKGDLVTFGNFEQDGDTSNGPEPISWIVLEAGEDSALLLSEDVLMAMPFHETRANVTWEDCALRAWLNEDFMADAFSEGERGQILAQQLDNPSNPRYETHGCGSTRDSVFLLSLNEASAYLRTAQERYSVGSARASRYAGLLHLETEGEESEYAGRANWWLRTPGAEQYSAAFTDRDGSIYEAGADVSHETFCGIRPAVRVRIRLPAAGTEDRQ